MYEQLLEEQHMLAKADIYDYCHRLHAAGILDGMLSSDIDMDYETVESVITEDFADDYLITYYEHDSRINSIADEPQDAHTDDCMTA